MRHCLLLLVFLSVAAVAVADVRVVVEPADGVSLPAAPTAGAARVEKNPSIVVLVPFFEVDATDPSGITTLFAVRNTGATTAHTVIEYYPTKPVLGHPWVAQAISFAPNQTRTFNVRDIPGIPVGPNGKKTGFVRVWSSDKPLAGDWFRLDPGNNFASGDALIDAKSLCTRFYSRFLNGGAFDGGTTFTFLLNTNSTAPSDPAVQGLIFSEAGTYRGIIKVYTSQISFELSTADMSAALLGTFGTIDWRANSLHVGKMVVEDTHKANGRFAISAEAMCADP